MLGKGQGTVRVSDGVCEGMGSTGGKGKGKGKGRVRVSKGRSE